MAAANVGTGVEPCVFCNAARDTFSHLHVCSVVLEAREENCPEMLQNSGTWDEATLFLQRRVDGSFFAMILAFYSAVWSVRNLRRRRGGTGGIAALVGKILECPWLLAFHSTRTRKERRAERVKPPKVIPGATVYRSDGASRRRRRAGAGAAGYAAAVWRPGQ